MRGVFINAIIFHYARHGLQRFQLHAVAGAPIFTGEILHSIVCAFGVLCSIRKKLNRLRVTLILVLLLVLAGVLGGLQLLKTAYESIPKGQNYSAAQDPTETTE